MGITVSEVRCPKDGSLMVVRTAARGPNAGRKFYVCSRPGCNEIIRYDIQNHIEVLKDERWDVRGTAATALGRIGPDAMATVPALNEVLSTDRDENVRKAAAAALKRIGKNT